MQYTPEQVATLLANRINQPHYIEAMIRKCIAESDLADLLCVLPVPTPAAGRTVKAAIKTENRQHGWSITYAESIAVDESDCNWRFADDGAELALHADVVYWEYT